MNIQARLYVIGQVTGVGFRGFITMKAREHHVTGWGRNVFHKPEIFGPHGGVEIVIQGKDDAVQAMIDTIKSGSPLSRIDDVQVHPEHIRETYTDFQIRKSEAFAYHT